MPLVAPAIEAKLLLEINTALASAFGASADAASAAQSHQQLAQAIAKAVAKVIVEELTTNAQVAPGSIVTAGSPASQVSVSAGKII